MISMNFSNLRYADDIDLMTDTLQHCQTLLNKVNDVCKEHELKINSTKTKVIV